MRAALLILAVCIAILALIYRVKNPEHLNLDAAARENAPGQFVQLSDGLTHYDLSGPDTGQRVVLVHGFSVPSYIWDSTAIALSSAGFRVARYDIYGRGYSDRPDVNYTLDLFDNQLTQLLDSLGWRDPVDVIGLSMGGAVSGTFAGRHPERVRSLVLVDPIAGRRDPVPGMFQLRFLGTMLWQTLVVPPMADGQLGDFVHPERWPDWPERYRDQMKYRGFGRALLSTSVELSWVKLDTVYSRVGTNGTRTLLIWGREDTAVPFDRADSVRRVIPQAEFHPIDSAGHLPHMERGDVVNPLLISFLRGGVIGSDTAAVNKP